MSDLISRSKAMENYCNALCPKLQKGEYCNDCIVKAWLNNQPIAYDPDEVVENLKERTDFLKNCTKYGNKNAEQQAESYSTMMMYEVADLVDDLIEIVKHCVVADDVCQWQSVSDGEFIQNPHTKRLYSNEPSMKNIYCNTCGKKIKVVE